MVQKSPGRSQEERKLFQSPQARLGDVLSLGLKLQDLGLDLCMLRLTFPGDRGVGMRGLCVVGSLKVAWAERTISNFTNMLAFLAPRDYCKKGPEDIPIYSEPPLLPPKLGVQEAPSKAQGRGKCPVRSCPRLHSVVMM